jgi:hypothetical protein
MLWSSNFQKAKTHSYEHDMFSGGIHLRRASVRDLCGGKKRECACAAAGTRTEAKLRTIATVTLRELRRTDLERASQILGRGMNDNPVIVRAFATLHAERRCRALTRFFHPVLHGLYQRGLHIFV